MTSHIRDRNSVLNIEADVVTLQEVLKNEEYNPLAVIEDTLF